MTHYGLVCPASTGHLNTMLPLGKEIQRRGHKVTLIGRLDAKSKTLAAGLEFRAIAEAELPSGSLAKSLSELGKLNGLAALKYTVDLLKQEAAVFLRDAPFAIRQAGVEALLVDQIKPAGGTVAEFLDIPFITICSAVVLNPEVTVPPAFTSWRYSPAWWAQVRNLTGYKLIGQVTKPIRDVIAEYRQEWKLPPHLSPNNSYSQLAQLSQQPAELEFPRQQLPQWFHFTGPYHSPIGREIPVFPDRELTGQPLVYASMGTVMGSVLKTFHHIAEACVGLDAQLVISLGGSASPESLPALPGSPLVVEYAPQLELLRKATLSITHAGMNTTLECLSNGVPIVAIPMVNDQPGIAARIAWVGAGEAIPISRVNTPRLQSAIKRVLTQESYKKNALMLQTAIRRTGGVSRAADIIEQVMSTGKPVLVQTQQ